MSPILKVLLVEDDPEVLLGTKQHAHGGTLFLDEIESMPPAMQVKRVLQERKIERLGSNDPVTVDFRVIVASKPNLIELVEKGQFRQDLFYERGGHRFAAATRAQGGHSAPVRALRARCSAPPSATGACCHRAATQ
jgi:Mg-chelatase subunit ChlI